jgi:hypothetical protein
MPLINTVEQANRLARAIASDLVMYHKDRVVQGLQQDNLFELLRDEFDEGRKLYASRVDPELLRTTNFYERAIVDVVVRPQGQTQCKAW